MRINWLIPFDCARAQIYHNTGKLTPERAEQILSGEFNRKPKKSTAAAFKVKPAIYKKYFTASISQKEFDSIVDEALALYLPRKRPRPSKLEIHHRKEEPIEKR